MAMCVMAVVADAPCQCFSPGANQITSPGPDREIATKLVGRGNPVATLRLVTIRAGDDALEDAAVLLDGFDGSDVVIVTRHEDALQAKLLACSLERLPEDRGGIALPPVLRDHDVANVPTKTLEIWIERVTDRDTTDDSGSGECKQECGRHVVRREILASLLFRQHIQIPPERHPLFIVVKKVS